MHKPPPAAAERSAEHSFRFLYAAESILFIDLTAQTLLLRWAGE